METSIDEITTSYDSNEESISVVIPAYNEEKGIKTTLLELKETLDKLNEKYEIIVVDDGSTDNTVNIVRTIDFVNLIQHPHNIGYGAALKTGIKNAKNDLILILDADGTYSPKEIQNLMEYTKDYDMVVGARIGNEVKVQLYRRPAKWFLTQLASYLSERKIPDLNSGMRIFKKKDIIHFFNILSDQFSFTTTSTLAYHTNGLSVKYVPINYYEREGKSKIKPIQDGLKFIMLIIRAIVYFNPLKVFLLVGNMFFILAIGTFLYNMIIRGILIDAIPIILFVAAIHTILYGLLADLIVKSRFLR
jgi:glycosyltransferase involved in cell wall biosynthesis